MKLKFIALFMATLIISLPIVFGADVNFQYDARGNLVNDGTYAYDYTSFNELWHVYLSNTSGIVLEEFEYHPLEERVLMKKVYNSSGAWKETVYYPFKELRRVVNSSGTYDFVIVEHEGQKIAELKPDGSKIFILGDHEGSSSVITNGSGSVLDNMSYTPFGQQIEGGNKTIYGYEGMEKDATTGDYDFHFRLYRSEIGKFLKPDTLLPNVYDPQQLNRYAFERNNPYNEVDKNGHCPVCAFAIGGPIRFQPGQAFLFSSTERYIN